MKNYPCFLMPLLFCSHVIVAQVGISDDNSLPDTSAMLDVKSTSKGMLVPRMSQSQRTAITAPAVGLLVYQTDSIAGYYYYTGANWVSVAGIGAGSISANNCIDYDGNAYPTFQVGTQVWMAENLRVTHYRNGDTIPNVTTSGAWGALTTGAYCWFNNAPTDYAKYGPLYNWYAVDDARGLCPEGWHVATDAEWTTLTTYLGGEAIAGGKMKSISPLWNNPNVDVTNSSGFGGLAGSFRFSNGSFVNLIGSSGYWWSSTEYDDDSAWYRSLSVANPIISRLNNLRGMGLSVRCVRD